MVLIIVFAPSGLPTPYCKGPAHIMRSRLWPLVGLASGVICPAFKYCSTGELQLLLCAQLLAQTSHVSRQGADVIPMFRTHSKWS